MLFSIFPHWQTNICNWNHKYSKVHWLFASTQAWTSKNTIESFIKIYNVGQMVSTCRQFDPFNATSNAFRFQSSTFYVESRAWHDHNRSSAKETNLQAIFVSFNWQGVKQVFCCVFDAQNLLDCRFNRNTIIPAQFVISEKENFYNLSFR